MKKDEVRVYPPGTSVLVKPQEDGYIRVIARPPLTKQANQQIMKNGHTAQKPK